MKLTRRLLVAGAVPVLLLGLAATTGTVTLSPAIAAEKGKSATTGAAGAAGVARQEQQQAQQKGCNKYPTDSQKYKGCMGSE